METMQAPGENTEENHVEKVQNGETNADKTETETQVICEQVSSASVVRKRRNVNRKRTSSLTRLREHTPIRDLSEKVASSDEEDLKETRPKTPERRRRRVSKNSSKSPQRFLDSTTTTTNTDDTQTNGESVTGPSTSRTEIQNGETKGETFDETQIEGSQSNDEVNKDGNQSEVTHKCKEINHGIEIAQPVGSLEEIMTNKIESLVNISQTEFIAMLDKAKKTIKSGRDRYNRMKSGSFKRSQSAPRQLTDQQLLESFKKAQEQSAEREQERKRANSLRKYSSDSARSTSSTDQKSLIPIKPSRRQVAKLPPSKPPPTKRKPLKHQYSNKIIEILDPKTSKVIKTKEVINIRMEWKDLLTVMKYFTIREIFCEYRKFKTDMREEYNKIRSLRRKCITQLIVMMAICGLGGILFKFVEGAFENYYKCGVKRVKRDFIDTLWIKSYSMKEEDWKSLARNRLRIFEEELHVAHEAGIHTYTGQRAWSFLNGVLYSLTIVTTIGYGHLYPITTLGKGLTILYALIGIPLFLIILTDFGKLFTRCIKYVWAFFRRLCYTGRCRRVRKTAHVEEIFKGAQIVYDIATMRRPSVFEADVKNDDPEAAAGETTPATPAPSNFEIDDQFNLPISLALSLLVLYIVLGAVAFYMLEDWSFFSSFYFVFISMSTIGFGDFVPEHHTFMIFSIIYLVFGLALMSMCINVVQDKLSDTFKEASAKLGATIGLSVNEEDGSIATVPPETVEMPEVHNLETGSIRSSAVAV